MEHLKGPLVPRAVQLNQVGPGRMRYGICWLVWDELAYSCDLLRSSDLLLGCLEESGRTCCLSSCLLVDESIGCLHFCSPSLVSSLSPCFLFPSLPHSSFSLSCHLSIIVIPVIVATLSLSVMFTATVVVALVLKSAFSIVYDIGLPSPTCDGLEWFRESGLQHFILSSF